MSICIALNQQIDCSALCSKIQRLIHDFAKNNNGSAENAILSIDIRECIEVNEEAKKLIYIE